MHVAQERGSNHFMMKVWERKKGVGYTLEKGYKMISVVFIEFMK